MVNEWSTPHSESESSKDRALGRGRLLPAPDGRNRPLPPLFLSEVHYGVLRTDHHVVQGITAARGPPMTRPRAKRLALDGSFLRLTSWPSLRPLACSSPATASHTQPTNVGSLPPPRLTVYCTLNFCSILPVQS